MKILLAGANGQLGRCVQDVFRDTDFELFALGRNSLNIADEAEVERVFETIRPSIIINAAAYTAVDKAESEPEIAMAINANGAANLAHSARRAGALLIHISTDYVFDGSKTSPYLELDATNPQGVYGSTKLQGEEFVRSECSRHVILRTAWVFSEYGNNFVKTMLLLGKERDELGVVSDQVGCPTYAGDIARACLTICEAEKVGAAKYGVYHFAGDVAVSWYDFAEAIFAVAVNSGVLIKAPKINAISTAQYPTPAKRPAYSVLSADRITADYGIPASNWRNALERSF